MFSSLFFFHYSQCHSPWKMQKVALTYLWCECHLPDLWHLQSTQPHTEALLTVLIYHPLSETSKIRNKCSNALKNVCCNVSSTWLYLTRRSVRIFMPLKCQEPIFVSSSPFLSNFLQSGFSPLWFNNKFQLPLVCKT